MNDNGVMYTGRTFNVQLAVETFHTYEVGFHFLRTAKARNGIWYAWKEECGNINDFTMGETEKEAFHSLIEKIHSLISYDSAATLWNQGMITDTLLVLIAEHDGKETP